MRPGTRVVHAGLPPAVQGEPLLHGPALAAPFHLAGDPASSPYAYTRQGNPTWAAYEAALAELEGGPAVLFASGMAACTALLQAVLAPGDVLVVPSDGYYLLREVAARHAEPSGIEVREVPTDTAAVVEAAPGARLVWVETPSNPGLDVVDLGEVARAAREAGALLAVDNTLATPLLQRPLELGADVSVASATKALSGHSDLLLGHVACADAGLADELRAVRTRTGAIAGPFEAWLAHRSLATLEVRVERQQQSARALAEMLRARADVADVRWPGLAGVVSFDAGAGDRAQRFLGACELVAEATSFGGVHSTAERRIRWGDAVAEGMIRLSAGIEATEDLVADVEQALERSD